MLGEEVGMDKLCVWCISRSKKHWNLFLPRPAKCTTLIHEKLKQEKIIKCTYVMFKGLLPDGKITFEARLYRFFSHFLST